jgi:RNA polymerase sigma-70 factor (ECF subfamily)
VDDVSRDLMVAQDGDDRAFTRVVVRAEQDVRRFCAWQLASDRTHLDDVVQETFVRAFRGLGTFRAESSGVAWLLSIARRACLDHHDRERRQRLSREVVREGAQSEVSAEQALVPVEWREHLARLSAEHVEALFLVRVLGHTYDEVATILGCPRGTVQSRVARARASLAEHLRDAHTRDAS